MDHREKIVDFQNSKEDQQTAIFKAMTPEQKLNAAPKLYHSARQLKRASLKTFHPEWDEKKIDIQSLEGKITENQLDESWIKITE